MSVPPFVQICLAVQVYHPSRDAFSGGGILSVFISLIMVHEQPIELNRAPDKSNLFKATFICLPRSTKDKIQLNTLEEMVVWITVMQTAQTPRPKRAWI